MSFFNVVFHAKTQCEHCGTRSVDLMMCPCQQVHYCSTNCQLEHWAVHKQKCTAARKGQPTLRSCANCGVTSLHLKSCPCGTVMYCNVGCQRQHWGVHRKMCSSWASTYKRTPVTKETASQTDESCTALIIAEKAKRADGESVDVSVYIDDVTAREGGGHPLKVGGKHRLSRRSISVNRMAMPPRSQETAAKRAAADGATSNPLGDFDGGAAGSNPFGPGDCTVVSVNNSADGSTRTNASTAAFAASGLLSNLDSSTHADGAGSTSATALADAQQKSQLAKDVEETVEAEAARRSLLAQQEDAGVSAILREHRTFVTLQRTQALQDAERKQRAVINAEYTTWLKKVKLPGS